MQRAAWTDERLDDLSRRMDDGFARVDRRLDRLDDGIRGLHATIMRVSGGMVVGLVLLVVTRAA